MQKYETVEGRLEIYQQALRDYKGGSVYRHGLCAYFRYHSVYHINIYHDMSIKLPELYKQKPKKTHSSWWYIP